MISIRNRNLKITLLQLVSHLQGAAELTNVLRLGYAYMHQWIKLSWFQVMPWRLFDPKASSEPTVTYCQLDPKEQTSVKFEKQQIQQNTRSPFSLALFNVNPSMDK